MDTAVENVQKEIKKGMLVRECSRREEYDHADALPCRPSRTARVDDGQMEGCDLKVVGPVF